MPIRASNIHEPSHNLLHSVFFLEQICLITSTQIALLNLLSLFLPPIEHYLPSPLLHMTASSASGALCASLALFFLESGRTERLRRAGQLLGVATAIIAIVALWSNSSISISSLTQSSIGQHAGHFLPAPVAFLLLGIIIFFLRSSHSLLSHITDALACILAFIVLVLLSEFIYGLMQIPGSSVVGPVKLPTLACLGLLAVTAVLRRTEFGVFSFLVTGGVDGQLARILAPLLLVLPIIREVSRARLLDSRLVPTHYVTAILSSSATLISFILLFGLSRLILRMQSEIQQLNLRDDLTGLYNYRGFNLFAEQAYRLAARSRQPFGVLFVDMDNLKVINDTLGHSTGSVFLVETARLLTSTFRETDVIGRLGGDEFVVAGLFESNEIEAAIERLRSGAATRNVMDGRSISLSLGYAASEPGSSESLKSVVARADKAMYKEKREKKRAVAS
ncbi:MAG: GGDEF domain-containing protein [Acidobacteria bacterium]|nr:GGDEF domain-containing protein [Acidobacteriota bacterium]